MQGRLMGKRVDAEYFVETSYDGESTEGCNYLMTVDMEMDPVQGYDIANWAAGYGDFDMVPDFNTLRVIPWLDATAMVLCDVAWHDGKPVRPSPRQGLRARIQRARKLGFEPMFGSELEFYLLKETYAEAHAKNYIGLTPSVPYILDYHVLATTYDEPFIRAVRKGMKAAGIQVESSKGEAWPGQQEINFRFADALTMADNHVIYKNGIKEMAHQNGGADANPYLCFAALLAAGLQGIEEELTLPPEFKGNAYESDVQRFPHALRDAIACLEQGRTARAAFGDDVIDHYLNYARTEQALFDKVVTNYERERLFERG